MRLNRIDLFAVVTVFGSFLLFIGLEIHDVVKPRPVSAESERVSYIHPYGKPRSDGYVWDGKVLKPYGASNSEGWTFDGRILKPYGAPNSKGWVVEGEVPMPAAAIPVLGLGKS